MRLVADIGEPPWLPSAADLGGGWEILELVGGGPSGAIYRGRHARLGMDVAIKVLLPRRESDAGLVTRLKAAARVDERMDHPNLVKTLDLFEGAGGHVYLVMEWLNGRTLASRLREGPCPLDEAVRIFASVCEGALAARREGTIHRHIEPAGVFLALTARGLVPKLLLDLGAIRAGAEPGAPACTSLEQIRARDAATHPGDVYATGLLLYEMLSGENPFAPPSIAGVVPSTGDWSLPTSTRIAPGLLAVLRRATARAPLLRQTSVAVLLAEVLAACAP